MGAYYITLRLQLKSVLRDEITNIIKSVFKDEIENYIKDSLHTVTNEIEVLKLDNTKLKADIDALELWKVEDTAVYWD
jgi:hypothetical protein